MVGGDGEDRAGDEGLAKLGNGVAVLGEADEGAIDPSELPPMVCSGWEGVDRAGREGRAVLGDGIAAPVVAGEGATDPAELPPMGWCGWEGETDIARQVHTHWAWRTFDCSFARILSRRERCKESGGPALCS